MPDDWERDGNNSTHLQRDACNLIPQVAFELRIHVCSRFFQLLAQIAQGLFLLGSLLQASGVPRGRRCCSSRSRSLDRHFGYRPFVACDQLHRRGRVEVCAKVSCDDARLANEFGVLSDKRTGSKGEHTTRGLVGV